MDRDTPFADVPSIDGVMLRARTLMGSYALETGVDPRFDNLRRHTNLINFAALGVAALSMVLPSIQIELLASAVSAVLARGIHAHLLIRTLNPDRLLRAGESRSWARDVALLPHPPPPALVDHALDALNNPTCTVRDLMRQCTVIASLEAEMCITSDAIASLEAETRITSDKEDMNG